MTGVTSVSSLARILLPAPTLVVPAQPDSAPPAGASQSTSSRSPPTSAHGLLASGVLSSLLQAQATAENAAVTARAAVATTTAAVNAYTAARDLPARPAGTAATTLLEGVVVYAT